MSKSKDEILWQYEKIKHESGTCFYYENVYLAMQEYAQQEAIEFAEWVTQNFKRCYPTKQVLDVDYPVWFVDGYKPQYENKPYTSQEIYQIFQQQKNKSISNE